MTGSAASDAVAEAMTTLTRRAFLPPAQRAHADEDRPLPLAHGQTNSQPSTVAAMLRLLDVPAGASVLDIGSGSGWTTALLGRLVGPEGRVLGLEIDPDLAVWGAENLAAWSMPWAAIEQADPSALGRPVEDGWDRILVSASGQQLPEALVAQLADGGRMVLPVRSTMWLVERHGEQVGRSPQGSYAFVPLR
ncbi:protein-L-isoaspartate O-methyltransferase family protein [Cellulomonas timonensis]|uniref:protein-L-isoaspartate O-methyltransferase family protein n=1 Tax=Cellulomonas timonensis TaxID=1689271 RepID=UPI00082C43C8|nr:protein-L-isoaspartate O-methyltransferase [Cellulomonas timonensis]